jgi:hypothetical protein
MKKIFMIVALVAMFGVNANALTFGCWSYKGGHPDLSFHVDDVNTQAEAEYKGLAKFIKIWGYTPEEIRCKY